jgi:L-lactate dehydrogenase complex protein LldG
MSARERILGTIRASITRGGAARDVAGAQARLADPKPNLIPARAQLPHGKQVELFIKQAETAAATVVRVANAADAPAAVADYLAAHNLPARAVVAPDPALDALPWRDTALELRAGATGGSDAVAVTGTFAAVAETGTLMIASGPDHPTTLDCLPESHIVVLRRDQVVGAYEDGWARLRAAGRGTPRTVVFTTGPSRTGDIEQTMQLGAHGPKRLHIVLIDEDGAS